VIAPPPAPSAAARAAIARRVFARAVARLEGIEVELPDGSLLRREPGAPRMTIRRDAFFHRLGAHGKIGFGEAYMAGDWETDDLSGVLVAFGRQLTTLVPRPLQRLRRLVEHPQPRGADNDRPGARRNIGHHYDLSNAFFALFLDESMTYSCAVFDEGETDLEPAQRRKYDLVLDLAGVCAGDRVLEIGTGWGGLALHAAATRGVSVSTVTISAEQAALARRRVSDAGLGERVSVELRDYRDLDGRFDAIVSVEMLEAVGERHLPVFFARCDRLLAPGGRVGLQTITMPHDRYLATRRSYTWMHKYVFPGGLIPSLRAVEEAMRQGSALRVVDGREIGDHYATTLRLWRERFRARADEARRLGFDACFSRMWDLYLAYCEAGFATRNLGVAQLRLERP
jgi:cyclopropane-fatty-acyl-phospholipid synthase